MKQLIILLSLCSISPLYAMYMETGSLTDEQTRAISHLRNFLGIVNDSQRHDKYKTTLVNLTVDQLQTREEIIQKSKTVLFTISLVNRPAIFEELNQAAETILYDVRKEKYAKMSFVQCHAKLFMVASMLAGIALASYIAYKLLIDENEEENKPTGDQAISTSP